MDFWLELEGLRLVFASLRLAFWDVRQALLFNRLFDQEHGWRDINAFVFFLRGDSLISLLNIIPLLQLFLLHPILNLNLFLQPHTLLLQLRDIQPLILTQLLKIKRPHIKPELYSILLNIQKPTVLQILNPIEAVIPPTFPLLKF